MYPFTNNLGNTTTTNFSFTTNNPFPPDNNNNNSTTIFEHSTTPNFSSFHPIHSPYSFYEEDLQHLHEYYLHQQQQETTVMTSMDRMEKHTGEDGPVDIGGSGPVKKYPVGADDALYNNSTTSKQIPRKGSSKKDRHSKINTARGPRDRRMRLSLDVAQKFFGLQDMLGFDKASKTVHWLLTKSKSAIKQVTNSISGGQNNLSNTASVSSTGNNSECEVLSGIINDESSLSLPREVTTPEKVKPREKRPAVSKAARGSRTFNPLAKEIREKARARARERTMEKRIRLGNGNNYNDNQVKKIPCIEGMDQTLNRRLRSWSPLEASGGEESSTQIHNAPVTWSGSLFSNYHHNAAISHENQFTEFQCFGNPWDHQGYYN